MNHQNQVYNHPQFGEICTAQREDGKVLFKAKDVTRSSGYAGNDIALPEKGKAVGRTRWTQKGRLFIYDLQKTDGLLPMHEIEPKTEQMEISSNIQ